MTSETEYQVEIATLREKLVNEVRRRVEMNLERSEYATAVAATRLEKDAAYKQLHDQAEGIAQMIAQIQQQGSVIEALHARISELAGVSS